jgi:rhodanese-related sulfurtransferase
LPADAAAQSDDTEASGDGSAGYTTLDSVQLATMLQNGDFFFVNVHVPYEGEIEGTDALIAFDKIADNLDKLPADKSAGIVLYCRSGRMSQIAAQELSRLGYTHVSHLAGGMIDWQKSGREIIEK